MGEGRLDDRHGDGRRRRRGASSPAGVTQRRLQDCPDCGQRQVVPSLHPGTTARCLRCDRLLRRARHDPMGRALALNLAALVLLGVACLMPLMTVSAGGMFLTADLFSGPQRLGTDGLWELAAVVLFTSIAAPCPEGRRHDLSPGRVAARLATGPSAPGLLLDRAAAALVDGRGLPVRRLRRLCEARRPGTYRAGSGDLCALRPHADHGRGGRGARPPGGLGGARSA